MINKLIDAALIVVLAAAACGQIPKLVQTARIAQLQILKDSRSSNWGHPLLLPKSK
jgi:hypothetical protein